MHSPSAPLILAAALNLAAAQPQSGLTLRAAQDSLFRHNPDLALLRLEVDIAEGQLREARSAWLPALDALGSYSYTTEVSRLSIKTPLPGGVPLQPQLGDHDRVELGLEANYPLFTGFSRGHNVHSKAAQVRVRDAQWRGARNQLSLRLAALFYAWQLGHLQAEYLEKVAEHSREFQKQLEDFVRAGTAVRSRALTAKARAKAAEVDVLTARSSRDSLALEVLEFLGRGPSQGPPPPLLPDTSAPIAWEDSALSASRPEQEALDQALSQARFGEKALAGQKLPQLYGMAGYRYANPGLNVNEDAFMHYGLVGLQLRWNLFDGARNRAQISQLRVQEQAIQERKRKLQGEWWKGMQTARLQRARWEAQYAVAQASFEAAQASADDLKRQWDAGVSTGLDWLEARNQAARAQMLMEQARTLQRLARLQWEYAAGRELRF